MGEVDNLHEQTIPSTNSAPESNFDNLQKNYPAYKDKIDFLNNEKLKIIKEPLAITMY